MKTLITSLLLLTMTWGFAQQSKQVTPGQILIDGATITTFDEVQISTMKAVIDTRKTIEYLSKLNQELHAELDTLENKNRILENQNFALKLRNQQLKDIDDIGVEQNKKQIRHNNKLIAQNNKKMYQNAVAIQQNQQLILANETLLLQQEQMLDRALWAIK